MRARSSPLKRQDGKDKAARCRLCHPLNQRGSGRRIELSWVFDLDVWPLMFSHDQSSKSEALITSNESSREFRLLTLSVLRWPYARSPESVPVVLLQLVWKPSVA